MKKFFYLLIVLFFIFQNNTATVQADTSDDFLNNTYDIIDEIDTDELEKVFNDNQYFNSINGNTLKDKLKNLLKEDSDDNLLQTILQSFTVDISRFLPFFITLFVIGVMSGMFESVKSDGCGKQMSGAVYFVCYLSSIAVLVSQFAILTTEVTKTVERVSGQMQVVMPLILSLMAVSGMSSSVAIYRPVVIVLSNSLTQFILTVLLPLITGITVLNLLSCFTDKIRLNKLKELLSSVFKWIIGISLTVFSFYLTVKGVTASTTDGVSLSAIKYLSGQVPIVGGFLREGADIFLASALLIKNAVGKMAVFGFFWEMLSPVLSLIVIIFGFNIVSALCEPFADLKIVNCYSGIAKSAGYLLAILLMTLFMFVLTVLLLICSSSII